jgi:uncharacterized surface protein with fasciclin (FAS1) repeats
MFSKTRFWSVFGAFIVIALVAAACQVPIAVEEAAPAQPEAAPEEAGLPSIAQIVAESASGETPEFTTLLAAVDAAGLVETLNGPGSFTVFAPTDAAFADLPEGLVEDLLADPEGALTDVLLYHAAGEAVPASAVVELESVTTLQGDDISIQVSDGSVILNDSAMVTATDIEASNGIVHVIDAVLIPPEPMAELPTIAQIVAESANGETPEFTTLLAAVDAAGLVETLDGPGSFTVFAPTDAAFADLPEGLVEDLLADPEGALTDVLLYHVAGEAVPASAVVELDAVPTLQGESISVQVKDGGVILNDDVMVTATDIEASNGVVHVIDAVLIPSS